MSSQTFIFGWINFALFAGALLWLVHPAAHQYFYARRARIRKDMLSSVLALRKARARFARSKEAYERLPEDIEARRRAIEEHGCEECRFIEEETEQRSQHMLETAARAIKEERAKALVAARAQALTEAFEIVRGRMAEGMSPAMRKRWFDEGLRELEGLTGRAARAPE